MVKEGTTDGAWHGHGRDEVTITAVSTVAPALPVQEHRLPLSNLDLILPPIDVSVFFCYVDPAGGRSHHPAGVLKAALAKTLVAYYPLAGEVVANAAGEPELLCSGRGVDVAEATADGTLLRDLRLGLPDESVEPLVPKKKAGVMSVQVTRFKCGGTVVGCTFDHRVCDAYSYNMFLVAWAAAARGSSAPPAPSFHRSFLAPREPAPLSCTAGNLADRLFVPVSRAPALPDTAAANRIYRVSAADVAALQASAGSGRTKLEAFTAHLWRLYAKAAAASRRQQQSCCMGVVVDGRTRLRRDGALSAYFGNVLTIPYGVMGTGALSTMALADVAGDVHRWVRGGGRDRRALPRAGQLGGGAAAGAHGGEGVPGPRPRRRGRDGLRGVIGDAAPRRRGGLRVGPPGVRVVPLPLARRRRLRDADAERARGRRLGGVRARGAGGSGGDGGGADGVQSVGW